MGRAPPNDGLATDLARPSPRAAPNVERVLEEHVRYERAHRRRQGGESGAGRAGGEVCRFANTLLTAGAELQRQQAEAATRSTHERPAQLPFLPLPAVRIGPVKVGSSPLSDTPIARPGAGLEVTEGSWSSRITRSRLASRRTFSPATADAHGKRARMAVTRSADRATWRSARPPVTTRRVMRHQWARLASRSS